MKFKMITARIDEQLLKEIQFLKMSLGLSNTTKVVIEAIHSLYASAKKNKSATPFQLLENLGLIGCFEGEPNLSQSYKDELTNSWTQKNAFMEKKAIIRSKQKQKAKRRK